MKLFRHRRPSLKTLLGNTKAKKRLKKSLGITAMLKPFRWWGNTKRRLERRGVFREGDHAPNGMLDSRLKCPSGRFAEPLLP